MLKILRCGTPATHHASCSSVCPRVQLSCIRLMLTLSLLTRLPYDTLVIPSLITGASAFVLVLQWIFAAWTRKSQPSSITIEEPENEPTPRATLSTCLRMLIDRSKGSALVVYQLTRVLGCLVLFGLSLYLLNVPGNDNVQRWSRIDQELIEKSPSILADPLQLGMCITFVCVRHPSVCNRAINIEF